VFLRLCGNSEVCEHIVWMRVSKHPHCLPELHTSCVISANWGRAENPLTLDYKSLQEPDRFPDGQFVTKVHF
jgi:hypothetical protein